MLFSRIMTQIPVIGGFKQMPSRRKLASAICDELEKVVGYLEGNSEPMRKIFAWHEEIA